MRPITLPATHYAASWPKDVQHTPAELTELGCRYAANPSEETLLEIIQSFHGYLLKYMAMILQGHVPYRGGDVNKDTHLLLQCFIPKGSPADRASLGAACRSLHLAFKGMDPAEIYDQLMMCLVRAVKRYDPSYSLKVREVAAAIDRQLHDHKFVKFVLTAKLSSFVGYDCTRYLRLLGKRGFLAPVTREGSIAGYKPTETWPPPEDFLNSKPVGLAYFVPKWFRYFLTDWIQWRMGELEAKEGVLQLDHRANAAPKPPRSGENVWDPPIPHAQGDFTIAHTGKSIAADVSLPKLPVDVGTLTLDWVSFKCDGHFGGLTPNDRHLLFLIFVRELDWKRIADTFDMTLREVKRWYNSLMNDLKERVSIRPGE
jgi:hypothetical protein